MNLPTMGARQASTLLRESALYTIDTSLDCRAVTPENPTGARGEGGRAHGGRKGRPCHRLAPGERAVFADIVGPGVIRHFWLTFRPGPPEQMRALWLEVYYDDCDEPSMSVPVLDFFGLPHGRPKHVTSAIMAVNEGRGFNCYLPMPFRRRMRLEVTNASSRTVDVFYQLDYTLEPVADDAGVLHVGFRRENPTTQGKDFTIVDGLRGPGRYLGCNIGIRVLDPAIWYGEGEVKIYRDGDARHPTICGTGLEDYAGSGWGLEEHQTLYAGCPLRVCDGTMMPDYIGFYRWHVPDPVVFASDLRVTIQQIGYAVFHDNESEAFERYQRTNPAASSGWKLEDNPPGILAQGVAERSDDYCATSYVYCVEPQAVPKLDVESALKDIARLDYEEPALFEAFDWLDYWI